MRSKRYFVTCLWDYRREDGTVFTRTTTLGNAGTTDSAKRIIGNIRKNCAYANPREFKVFDSFAEVNPETNFVPCVYSIEK